MRTTLPEPWLSFLRELDPIAGEPTKIPCIGGFAVTQHYGSARTTVDLDVIDVAPIASRNRLLEAGGKGSSLARKHRVYLDFVGIAQVPYEYEERLAPIVPSQTALGDVTEPLAEFLMRDVSAQHLDLQKQMVTKIPFHTQTSEEETYLETRVYVGARGCVVTAIVNPGLRLEGMLAEIGCL